MKEKIPKHFRSRKKSRLKLDIILYRYKRENNNGKRTVFTSARTWKAGASLTHLGLIGTAMESFLFEILKFNSSCYMSFFIYYFLIFIFFIIYIYNL